MVVSASVPAHFPARVRILARPGTRVGKGTGITLAVDTTTLTAGRRLPHAGPHHEMYTVRALARVHVRRPRSDAVACLARGGGLLAMSAVGMVKGAVQGRTALCARAAPDLGRPLGPGQGQGSALALDLTLGPILAHVPARARHHTLRILGVAVGPDPIAGVVEAIAETILETAGLVRLIPRIHDGGIIRFRAPAVRCAS